MSIYDAAIAYAKNDTPLVVFAGKGPLAPDQAAIGRQKGTTFARVSAQDIAKGFERIRRSNLVGMGVTPLQFTGDATWEKLKLNGTETVSIKGLEGKLKPRQKLDMIHPRVLMAESKRIDYSSRIDTQDEVDTSKMAVFAVCSAPAYRLNAVRVAFNPRNQQQ